MGPLPSIELDGFHLSAVFLFVWVEIKGRLIEVGFNSRSRQDKQDLLVSKEQVDTAAEQLKTVRSRTRRSAAAARVDTRLKFNEATGKSWKNGKRVGGQPKRPSGSVAHEAAVAKGGTRVKKAA